MRRAGWASSRIRDWRLKFLVRQLVPQFVAFGGQVLSVVFVGRRHDGDLVDHLEVEPAVDKRIGFFGIVC